MMGIATLTRVTCFDLFSVSMRVERQLAIVAFGMATTSPGLTRGANHNPLPRLEAQAPLDRQAAALQFSPQFALDKTASDLATSGCGKLGIISTEQ